MVRDSLKNPQVSLETWRRGVNRITGGFQLIDFTRFNFSLDRGIIGCPLLFSYCYFKLISSIGGNTGELVDFFC